MKEQNITISKQFVTLTDIKSIEAVHKIELTEEQRIGILKEYERVVTDNADDWETIIGDLISKYNTKETADRDWMYKWIRSKSGK